MIPTEEKHLIDLLFAQINLDLRNLDGTSPPRVTPLWYINADDDGEYVELPLVEGQQIRLVYAATTGHYRFKLADTLIVWVAWVGGGPVVSVLPTIISLETEPAKLMALQKCLMAAHVLGRLWIQHREVLAVRRASEKSHAKTPDLALLVCGTQELSPDTTHAALQQSEVWPRCALLVTGDSAGPDSAAHVLLPPSVQRAVIPQLAPFHKLSIGCLYHHQAWEHLLKEAMHQDLAVAMIALWDGHSQGTASTILQASCHPQVRLEVWLCQDLAPPQLLDTHRAIALCRTVRAQHGPPLQVSVTFLFPAPHEDKDP